MRNKGYKFLELFNPNKTWFIIPYMFKNKRVLLKCDISTIYLWKIRLIIDIIILLVGREALF